MKTQKTLIHTLIVVLGIAFTSCEKDTSFDQIVDNETSEQLSAKAKNKCNVRFIKKADLFAVFFNAKGKKLEVKIPEKAIDFDNNNKEVAIYFENKKFLNRPFFKSGITRYGIISKNVLSNPIDLGIPLYFSPIRGRADSTIIFPKNAIDEKRSTKKEVVSKRRIFPKGKRVQYFTKLEKPEKRFVGIITGGVSPKKTCPKF